LIVAICFVDLAHVGRQIHPRTDPSIYDHIPLETLRLVARASEPGGRVAVVSDRLGAQVLYGSRSAEAYRYSKDMLGGSQFRSVHMVGPIGNLIGRRYFEFTRPLRIAGESPQLQQRVLDLLSVQAVIHALPVHRVLVGGSVALKVASNRSALPRALLIRDYEVIADRTRAEARVVEPSFDPRQTVVLAVDPELSRKPVRREGDRVGEVQYGWNSTTVRLQARAPALLLLNESFAEGWEARVDGRPTPIIRANGFFRAVPVEEGTQEVHFEYRPRSAYAGLWISLVSLALTLLLWRRSLPGARSQRPTRQRIGDLFFDPKDNESSPRERLTFALVYSSTRNSRGSSSSARPKG
jgi:hypothetical protein